MKRYLITFYISIWSSLLAHAQATLPFSTITVDALGASSFYVSKPYQMYSTKNVYGRLQLSTNLTQRFNVYLATSALYASHATLPDYQSILFLLGTSYKWKLNNFMSVTPSIGFGNHYMKFEKTPVVNVYESESEMLAEAGLHANVAVYKKLGITLGTRFQRTFLYHRLDSWNVEAGLSYQLNTPKIIQRFLN